MSAALGDENADALFLVTAAGTIVDCVLQDLHTEDDVAQAVHGGLRREVLAAAIQRARDDGIRPSGWQMHPALAARFSPALRAVLV